MALNQELYRALPHVLEGQARLAVDSEGRPDGVRFYILYAAALIYGSADAALTLTLHNLGREARLHERQIFEIYIRAAFFAANPREAEIAVRGRSGAPSANASERFWEPSIDQMFGTEQSLERRRAFSLFYRGPTQMPHATFAGTGAVVTSNGISFDSREQRANFGVESTTVLLLAFYELLNSTLRLDLERQLSVYRGRWHAIEERLAEGDP